MKKLMTSIILICAFVSAFALIFFLPAPPLLSGINFSTAVYDENQHLLRLTLSNDEKYRVFTPLQDIAPQLIEATLLQEDQYFRWHFGVNPLALGKALWQTYVLKSRRMGASTISMQVARLRFGINSKSISGKLKQLVYALRLEAHYSKDQLLEAYLNLAPYGGNIEGVGAASLIYFNHPASTLDLPQALTLSVIPQNPNKRTPDNQNLQQIRQRLFVRWLNQHPADSPFQPILDLPLVMRSVHDLPFFAPHLINKILSKKPSSLQPIQTTLDMRLQTLIERISKNYLQRKHFLGASNTAILLVDTRDMTIKAALGSANYADPQISGQINGLDIKRSPGSTLKPFIYALAFDQGLIHPATVLKDVPHSFGSYNPENFDYDFLGPVKARDALVLSRNIPAIALASQLKHPNLFDLLEKGHISQLKAESYYGLALTLGGAELSLRELTSLYAMLANEGLWHPLRTLKNDPQTIGERLLSPEASFLVLDILKNTQRPENYAHSKTAVSWKTGTSSGYRDAWTVGIAGPYVLTVWIGNFNNKGNPAFVGKNIAAPLFFAILEAIEQEHGKLTELAHYPQMMNLTRIPVCKASGLLPTRYCQDTEMTWFIPGKSPIRSDTIYREVAINQQNGLRTCHIDSNTRFAVYEFWPSDLLRIFKQAGISRRSPPPYEADCSLTAGINSSAPMITSPKTEIDYIVRRDSSQETLVPLNAVTDGDVRTVYWFINDMFLAKGRAGQSLFWPAKSGHFVVRVVDDHGMSDMRDLNVKVDG